MDDPTQWLGLRPARPRPSHHAACLWSFLIKVPIGAPDSKVFPDTIVQWMSRSRAHNVAEWEPQLLSEELRAVLPPALVRTRQEMAMMSTRIALLLAGI